MDKKELCILYIDDDVELSELICRFLETKGITVDYTDSGRMGVEKYNPKVHKLVVVDQFMPDLSGKEVIQELKARSTNVRIVMISGSENPEDEKNALASGASAFLKKGMHMDLVEEINQFLKCQMS